MQPTGVGGVFSIAGALTAGMPELGRRTVNKVLVIGGSAGSLEPLSVLIAGLGPDLQAAVFVVMHIPAWQRSDLPYILNRSSSLYVSHAAPNQQIEAGRVYVAPPDHHM